MPRGPTKNIINLTKPPTMTPSTSLDESPSKTETLALLGNSNNNKSLVPANNEQSKRRIITVKRVLPTLAPYPPAAPVPTSQQLLSGQLSVFREIAPKRRASMDDMSTSNSNNNNTTVETTMPLAANIFPSALFPPIQARPSAINQTMLDSSSSSSLSFPSNATMAQTSPPRIRNSHKISERRRRKEMNDAFAALRSLLPKTTSLTCSPISASLLRDQNINNSNGNVGGSVGLVGNVRVPDSKWDVLNRVCDFIDRLALTEAFLKQERAKLMLARQEENHPEPQGSYASTPTADEHQLLQSPQ